MSSYRPTEDYLRAAATRIPTVEFLIATLMAHLLALEKPLDEKAFFLSAGGHCKYGCSVYCGTVLHGSYTGVGSGSFNFDKSL